MAAGDLVVADHQCEVRTTLFGATSNIEWVGVEGLDDQEVKVADLDLTGDGMGPGIDRLAARTVVNTFQIRNATPATLETHLGTFKTAWSLGATTTFHFRLRGTKHYLNGRTRRYTVDQSKTKFGLIRITAEFYATDPTIH